MPKAKRSKIWEFFRKADDQHVTCNLCFTDFKNSGNTTNMINHLRARHREHFEALHFPKKLHSMKTKKSKADENVDDNEGDETAVQSEIINPSRYIVLESQSLLDSSGSIETPHCLSTTSVYPRKRRNNHVMADQSYVYREAPESEPKKKASSDELYSSFIGQRVHDILCNLQVKDKIRFRNALSSLLDYEETKMLDKGGERRNEPRLDVEYDSNKCFQIDEAEV